MSAIYIDMASELVVPECPCSFVLVLIRWAPANRKINKVCSMLILHLRQVQIVNNTFSFIYALSNINKDKDTFPKYWDKLYIE